MSNLLSLSFVSIQEVIFQITLIFIKISVGFQGKICSPIMEDKDLRDPVVCTG